jgi:hypothetical protein
MKKYVYQIYYDDETKRQLLPGFIPLDNTRNSRPDWFEFFVILNFLRNNTLEEGAWYGFLSPKFYKKTGCTSDFVNSNLDKHGDKFGVIVFPYSWDQLSFFLNPFEQGEMCHPGLLMATQNFINKINLKIDLEKLVTDTTSSVFSNFIIAKKDYWIKWRWLAEEYFKYVEGDVKHQILTSYKTKSNPVPMKTFIQERFATLILSSGGYRTLRLEQNIINPISTKLFPDNAKTRVMLQTCDLMKFKYRQTLDNKYIDMYWMIRNEIKFSKIIFK